MKKNGKQTVLIVFLLVIFIGAILVGLYFNKGHIKDLTGKSDESSNTFINDNVELSSEDVLDSETVSSSEKDVTIDNKKSELKGSESIQTTKNKESKQKTFKMSMNGMEVKATFVYTDDTVKNLILQYKIKYENWGITDEEAVKEISKTLGIDAEQEGVESTISTKDNEALINLDIEYSKVDKKFVSILFGEENEFYQSMKKTEKSLINQGFNEVK
ncbi:DUF1307 domain-containing protein [Enterococcus faecalis]|uniref:DUF1307 domain-containing protein n=1 Tax=Enterococcus faecalis TaxID=1351 RepID=UPI0025B0C179|nr:DUF1307 domain-containing protein [Enterococcus faecalis]MDN3185477.1 DUF1307 domain-containing protein [Enterococcus faecalis]